MSSKTIYVNKFIDDSMTPIEEAQKMFSQLVKEHETLIENHGDGFEIKSLELEILRTEAQLRNLGVDF